jgi:hypothetical protein
MKTVLRHILQAWISFGNILLFINTRIILTLLYFCVLPFLAIPYQIFSFFQKKKGTEWKKSLSHNISQPF